MTEVLITDRVRLGRSALLWRDSDVVWRETESAPTMPMERRDCPPLPIIEWQDGPIEPERVQSWPLMTRIRLWLAARLIGL